MVFLYKLKGEHSNNQLYEIYNLQSPLLITTPESKGKLTRIFHVIDFWGLNV